MDAIDPETMQEWWNYISDEQGDEGRIGYMLRNYSAIAPRGACVELLRFLGTKATLIAHRVYDKDTGAGCYSLATPKKTWIIRVDPTTPTTAGPKRYPSMVVCW